MSGSGNISNNNSPAVRPPVGGKPRGERTPVSTAAVPPSRKSRKSPPRAALNRIPPPERLQLMIDKAVTALQQGVFWDRGSIINIVL